MGPEGGGETLLVIALTENYVTKDYHHHIKIEFIFTSSLKYARGCAR